MTDTSKVAALSELLPEDAIDEIVDLANNGKRRKKDFMTVIERYRGELLKKGVDADYLGYVLEHQVHLLIIDQGGN